MDWEAPADAWYVWVAVTIISLAMAGIVLGLPTGPTPDADRAANAIEETSGSSYEAATTYEHDADAVRIDGKTIELKNDHGTDRASINYGQVIVVNGDDRLENLTYGSGFDEEFDAELDDPTRDAATAFVTRTADARDANSGEWINSTDDLTVRRVVVEPDEVTDPEISVSIEDDWWESVDLFTYFFDVPQYVEITHRGPHEDTVEYTIEAGNVIEDEYGIEEFWDDADDAEWSDGDCWFDTCTGDDPEELLNPVQHAELSITHPARYDSNRIELDDRVEDGTGEDVWVGDYPITVTAESDHYSCERTISDRSGFDTDLCRTVETGTASEDLADEMGWLELNDETEAYHVTLVVV